MDFVAVAQQPARLGIERERSESGFQEGAAGPGNSWVFFTIAGPAARS
jgi:hypothetical protein